MTRINTIRRIALATAFTALAAPLAAQGQMPAPPIPGPYPLAPVPPVVLQGTGRGLPAAEVFHQGPPPGLQLPYWMQQPPAAGGAQTQSTPVVTDAAPTRTMPPAAEPPVARAPGPVYGQVMPQGYFPGYVAPGRNAPAWVSPPGAGNTAQTTAPQGYRPYVPQGYAVPPGWGWQAPPGWAQPRAGRTGQ